MISIRHKPGTILGGLSEEIAVSILAEVIAVRRGGKVSIRSRQGRS
jgi:xanthine/CO dehydrogenase XdhC/CoxF family maturation factor